MAVRYELPEAPPDDWAPVLPFDDFMTYVFIWLQDQHVGIVGPTDQGKTNLAYHLLLLRKYIAYFAIKTKDKTLTAYGKQGGFERIYDWPPTKNRWIFKRPVTAEEMPRRLIWPDATALNSEAEQQRVFRKALHDIYASGGWCPVFDDYWYLQAMLGFEKDTKKFLANARSNDIPMMVCAQRPAGNRLVELFDQTTHLFFARDQDEPNLKRIGGVGAQSSKLIQGYVANLEPYQFLYVNARKGWMYRTTAPKLDIAA